jgi:hypothetical protein
MESLIEIPKSVESRRAVVTGIGGSLLALSRAQDQPVEEGLSQVLEDLALGLERNVRVREEMAERAREHNLRMAEMYRAIIELLELLRQRLEEEQSMRAGLAPLASSMTSAFAEMNARIEAQEERQHETLENTLRQWVAERQSAETERILEMERLQVQARMEANRMLRMMWLGAGLAAVGAGVAMFLVNN